LQSLIQTHQETKKLIPEKKIIKIFSETLIGINKLHSLDIFHRDIKSANIFMSSDEEAKLGDLNVSKLAKLGLVNK
jgi:NIMA (never in mitosis gene a)-related kinase